jgi:hypothetical protein
VFLCGFEGSLVDPKKRPPADIWSCGRSHWLDYFLVVTLAATLASSASFFFLVDASDFVCFCVACFFVDFGDLSPIVTSFGPLELLPRYASTRDEHPRF